MKLPMRLGFIVAITIVSALYIYPWSEAPSWVKPYKLGLDLHGGVELDYKVDLTEVRANTGTEFSELTIIDSLKGIVDKRVRSLGLEEPTIQTAQYGPGESHIIVQIPVRDYGNITEEEKRVKNAEDIARAKETIGKVVQLEFRESKTVTTEADKQARSELLEKALLEVKDTPFATVGTKYQSQYENVFYVANSGALIREAALPGIENISTFPYTSPVTYMPGEEVLSVDESGSGITTRGPGGYVIVHLESMREVPAPALGTGGLETTKEYEYALIYADERPSLWTAAKTADGRVLNDKNLTRAGVSFTQAGAPQVDLIFNDEGRTIFSELTKRLIGKQIAIFVGGELLTAPTVQDIISDGRAVITGDYTIQGAQQLANDINTGIVPAPIYLTSERTIDAKIGRDALSEIFLAALIGLGAIILLLVYFYRVGGLLAGIALVVYSLLLIALVKAVGITLTLASIAGVILSIGLAIDANILIFERMKEAMKVGQNIEKSITVGFGRSWSAIWDSHITSLTSAIILYVFGISLIKGFGLMLGLGIVLSLFTAMWVSRILILAVGRTSIGKNPKLFIGLKD